MYKKLSTRTRALLSACLQNSSGDEDEKNVSNDVIENSPRNSPKERQKKALPIADANLPELNNIENLSHIKPGEKSIDPLSGDGCFEDLNINSHDNVGDKSIEPPPYSPLTPRPLSNFNTRVYENQCMNFSPSNDECIKSLEYYAQSNSIVAEKNIEALELSPLSSKENMLPDSQSSPLRSMSPETSNIYNILSGVFENECKTPENTFNIDENQPSTSTASLITSNFILNSDDSVQDPNYDCNVDISGSDTRSDVSVSLISSKVDVSVIPYDVNEFQTSFHQTSQVNTIETTTLSPSQGRPKKGRKRKYGEHSREERKKQKYQNLSYMNSKSQLIQPKPFLNFDCSCPKKCKENISIKDRFKEFKKFYDLGTYEAQNMFIAACVREAPIKRSYVTASSTKSRTKTFSREYYLKDVLVCKKMFLSTLQTTSKRVNTSMCKKRNNCIKDERGKQGGHNRATSESEKFVINVIQKLPTYVSHYRRTDCNDAKFLRSDMNFPKIYELYSDEAKSAGQKVLSFGKVKQVFLTKFNLRTKPLKKDTCNKCDYFSSKKKQGSEEEKALVEDAHREHIQKAKILQNQLKSDMKLAQNDPFTETVTFDLQKTLPLPRIPTNVVFYKRQLWVYNLGIHSGSNDQAHCNIWVEGEAGRGSQEVGSCLIKHVMERLGNKKVKNLILWSDSCGGQNRNIKLTLMMKALLSDHPTLQTVRLRFLESGHSFLPNDTDFGRIECALKLQQRLYTPEDYMQIMRKCKKNNPMQVHRMRQEDFLSSVNLERKIINRKKATDGSKVSWLNTKEIMVKKEEQLLIYMRSNLNDDFVEVNLKKNLRVNQDRLTIKMMDQLWPNGKPIPEAKLKDLNSLMHLIPEDVQGFYKKLTGDVAVEDDIDGFSGEIDFQVEVDEGDNLMEATD